MYFRFDCKVDQNTEKVVSFFAFLAQSESGIQGPVDSLRAVPSDP